MEVEFTMHEYEGVIQINRDLYCDGYGITSLKLPEGIESVFCRDNKIKELILPEGVERVYCSENELTELHVPDSVTHLCCDGNLFDYDTCNCKHVHIYY